MGRARVDWSAYEDGALLLEDALEVGVISAEEFGHLHLLPEVGYRPNISAARRALMELLDDRDGPVLNPLLDATMMLRRAIEDGLITREQGLAAWVRCQEKRVTLYALRERLRQLVMERQAAEAEAVVTEAEARRADFEVVDGGGGLHDTDGISQDDGCLHFVSPDGKKTAVHDDDVDRWILISVSRLRPVHRAPLAHWLRNRGY